MAARAETSNLIRIARAPVVVLLAVATLLGPSGHAQERPLPDLPTLLRASREHLRDDWRLDHRYAYTERRTEYARGSDGREQVKSVKVFEVAPSATGRPYRRLVEVNGRRRSAEELARDDREHDRRVAERDRETPAERQRRLDRQAERDREEQATWDDLSRVYSFSIAGRERIDGQLLVVVDFQPRPDAQPQSDNGRRMTKVRGRAWISEDDQQVARIDAHVLDDISIGWGLIGKLYAGATASYVRRKVDGREWLPAQLSYEASGRALIRRFTVHQVIDYLDYRKTH